MAESRPLSRKRQRADDEDEDGGQKKLLLFAGLGGGVLVCLVAAYFLFGRSTPKGTTDPESKQRLTTILELYKLHINQKGKAPASEEAFKEFVKGLPPEAKARLKSDNLDELLTSDRDGQKFTVRWGKTFQPGGGATEALAWETTGKGMTRFVALTMGYVEEYDDETFNSIKKK